jgi:hypothetical protein
VLVEKDVNRGRSSVRDVLVVELPSYRVGRSMEGEGRTDKKCSPLMPAMTPMFRAH